MRETYIYVVRILITELSRKKMDRLAEHKKYKRSYKILRIVRYILIILSIILLLYALLSIIYKNSAELNRNSGAATVLLTILLTSITGYYAVITHKYFLYEKIRRIKEIRPVITFEIINISFDNFQGYSTDSNITKMFTVNFKIKNHNGTAINFNQEYELPYKYSETDSSWHYVIIQNSNEDNVNELKRDETFTRSITNYTYDLMITDNPNPKLYFFVRLNYEDLEQNSYSHRIFFSLYKIYENLYTTKMYEEIDFIEFSKVRSFRGSSYNTNDEIRPFLTRYR